MRYGKEVGYLVRATHSPQCAARDPEGFSTTHRYYKYWENLVRLILLEAATERQKCIFLIRVEDVRGKVIAMADVQTNSRDHRVCI